MEILSPKIVLTWENKILNIHPSILPLFKGLNTHQRALEAREKFHGATVHFVDKKLDNGKIIAHCIIPIYLNDNKQSLSGRLLFKEHILYIKCIYFFINKVNIKKSILYYFNKSLIIIKKM